MWTALNHIANSREGGDDSPRKIFLAARHHAVRDPEAPTTEMAKKGGSGSGAFAARRITVPFSTHKPGEELPPGTKTYTVSTTIGERKKRAPEEPSAFKLNDKQKEQITKLFGEGKSEEAKALKQQWREAHEKKERRRLKLKTVDKQYRHSRDKEGNAKPYIEKDEAGNEVAKHEPPVQVRVKTDEKGRPIYDSNGHFRLTDNPKEGRLIRTWTRDFPHPESELGRERHKAFAKHDLEQRKGTAQGVQERQAGPGTRRRGGFSDVQSAALSSLQAAAVTGTSDFHHHDDPEAVRKAQALIKQYYSGKKRTKRYDPDEEGGSAWIALKTGISEHRIRSMIPSKKNPHGTTVVPMRDIAHQALRYVQEGKGKLTDRWVASALSRLLTERGKQSARAVRKQQSQGAAWHAITGGDDEGDRTVGDDDVIDVASGDELTPGVSRIGARIPKSKQAKLNLLYPGGRPEAPSAPKPPTMPKAPDLKEPKAPDLTEPKDPGADASKEEKKAYKAALAAYKKAMGAHQREKEKYDKKMSAHHQKVAGLQDAHERAMKAHKEQLREFEGLREKQKTHEAINRLMWQGRRSDKPPHSNINIDDVSEFFLGRQFVHPDAKVPPPEAPPEGASKEQMDAYHKALASHERLKHRLADEDVDESKLTPRQKANLEHRRAHEHLMSIIEPLKRTKAVKKPEHPGADASPEELDAYEKKRKAYAAAVKAPLNVTLEPLMKLLQHHGGLHPSATALERMKLGLKPEPQARPGTGGKASIRTVGAPFRGAAAKEEKLRKEKLLKADKLFGPWLHKEFIDAARRVWPMDPSEVDLDAARKSYGPKGAKMSLETGDIVGSSHPTGVRIPQLNKDASEEDREEAKRTLAARHKSLISMLSYVVHGLTDPKEQSEHQDKITAIKTHLENGQNKKAQELASKHGFSSPESADKEHIDSLIHRVTADPELRQKIGVDNESDYAHRSARDMLRNALTHLGKHAGGRFADLAVSIREGGEVREGRPGPHYSSLRSGRKLEPRAPTQTSVPERERIYPPPPPGAATRTFDRDEYQKIVDLSKLGAEDYKSAESTLKAKPFKDAPSAATLALLGKRARAADQPRVKGELEKEQRKSLATIRAGTKQKATDPSGVGPHKPEDAEQRKAGVEVTDAEVRRQEAERRQARQAKQLKLTPMVREPERLTRAKLAPPTRETGSKGQLPFEHPKDEPEPRPLKPGKKGPGETKAPHGQIETGVTTRAQIDPADVHAHELERLRKRAERTGNVTDKEAYEALAKKGAPESQPKPPKGGFEGKLGTGKHSDTAWWEDRKRRREGNPAPEPTKKKKKKGPVSWVGRGKVPSWVSQDAPTQLSGPEKSGWVGQAEPGRRSWAAKGKAATWVGQSPRKGPKRTPKGGERPRKSFASRVAETVPKQKTTKRSTEAPEPKKTRGKPGLDRPTSMPPEGAISKTTFTPRPDETPSIPHPPSQRRISGEAPSATRKAGKETPPPAPKRSEMSFLTPEQARENKRKWEERKRIEGERQRAAFAERRKKQQQQTAARRRDEKASAEPKQAEEWMLSRTALAIFERV